VAGTGILKHEHDLGMRQINTFKISFPCKSRAYTDARRLKENVTCFNCFDLPRHAFVFSMRCGRPQTSFITWTLNLWNVASIIKSIPFMVFS
jgi:hypothetical protein